MGDDMTTDHADIAADTYRLAIRIARATLTMDTATLKRVQTRLARIIVDCHVPPVQPVPGAREVMRDGE